MTQANPDISVAEADLDDRVCPACRCRVRVAPMYFACLECQRRYPHALLKAASDTFDYAARLVTGELVFFESATFGGDWVHLELSPPDPDAPPFAVPRPRGVDVRIDSIVWCVDAPWGS